MDEWKGLKVWVCSYKQKTEGYLEDWSGIYEVSINGLVRDAKTKELLNQFMTKKYPYYQVYLIKNGKKYKRLVHRCVATTFPEICGNYFQCAVVNHLDENKTNNIASNLSWCTYKENINYGTAKERAKNNRKKKKICQNKPELKIWQIAILENY